MSREFCWTVILVFAVFTNLSLGTHTRAQQKIMVGWLENVYLPEQGCVIRAKVDTGAKNSSIHTLDLEYVEDAGRPPGTRVRFKTVDKDKKTQVIEADLVRLVRIKRNGPSSETRLEIELEICLGGVRKRIRVNLTDRSEMNYSMILGRTALAGDFIVDVSEKYVAKSGCPEE
jgi:hypothetical protein